MRLSGELYARADSWRPPGTRGLANLLGAADRLFDRLYSSAYNPLYRTGTLASLCLAVTLVTGVYLLFVYQTAQPYASVVAIQSDPWLGRWLRALHRYASDAAVIAVALHALRVLLQGKTYGPRALAWITGVLLTGMMFVSALTGFVLVWDQFGQKLAVAGAKMLRLLPLFPEPPDRSFVGDRPVPPQFFFMNLFLHVAVPLGMVAFLWLHTVRLARPAWFPERRVMGVTLAGLVALSLAWPAPLPPAADLLAIPGRVDVDWFYGFWLPLAHGSPAAGLATLTIVTGLLLAAPWLARPRRVQVPGPSFADPDSCEGCQQCFTDCPYDAIRMVPGKYPDKHPLLAEVQGDLCVSCGLCAGSCSSLAIGPPARTARHQLASARQIVSRTPDPGRQTLVVACRSNVGVGARLDDSLAAQHASARFDVDCVGSLHPGTVSYLGRHFASTVILGCPPQNCLHREGPTLVEARILRDRRPAVPGQLARLPVRVLHASIGEWPRIVSAIEAARPAPSRLGAFTGPLGRSVGGAVFAAVLLALLAVGSRWPQGTDPDHALLRLGWRLTGQANERCRDLSPEELARRPAHMRTPRECVSWVPPYDLSAVVDGRVAVARRVTSPGLRADRPLSVEEDLAITPGQHTVSITFAPADPRSAGISLRLERALRFERGRVVLVTTEDDQLIAH